MQGQLSVSLRRRDASSDQPVERPATWEAAQTAAIICDMWDQHWCAGASRRVAEMASHETGKAANQRKQRRVMS